MKTILLTLCLALAGCDSSSHDPKPHYNSRITIYRGDTTPDRFNADVVMYGNGWVEYISPINGHRVHLSGTFEVERLD